LLNSKIPFCLHLFVKTRLACGSTSRNHMAPHNSYMVSRDCLDARNPSGNQRMVNRVVQKCPRPKVRGWKFIDILVRIQTSKSRECILMLILFAFVTPSLTELIFPSLSMATCDDRGHTLNLSKLVNLFSNCFYPNLFVLA
jgi:hypothetical protein